MAHRVNKPSTESAATLAASAVDRYGQELRRFLVRRLHGAQSVPDVAQEIYLRLLRLNNTEQIRDYRAYLYKVAAHVVHEYKLQARRETVTFDSVVAEEATRRSGLDTPDRLSEQLSTQAQLERVLAQLHPTCRAVFLLQKLHGMSYAEVAQALNLSTHTVQKYLFRALAALRAAQW